MSHVRSIKPVLIRTAQPRGKINLEVIKFGFRTLALSILLAGGVSIFIQFLYPSSLALPQTNIAGKDYGFKFNNSIVQDIAGLNKQKITIFSTTRTLKFTPQEIGLTFTGQQDAEKVMNYSWK